MAEAIKAAYDETADVLYLTVGEPDRRSRSRSDEHGLIWRTTPDGQCRGVTVLNFRAWANRGKELAGLLAKNLHTSPKKVAEQLADVA